MAYGQELSRKRVSTRVLVAEEKIKAMYITAATGVFTSLTVNGDLGIGDNIKGLHISAVTLEADDFIVHDDFVVTDTVKALSVSGVTLFADSIKAGTNIVSSPSSWKMLSVSGVTLFANDILGNGDLVMGDTVKALSVSGITMYADDVLVYDDLVVSDTIKALSVSGITLFANDILATGDVVVGDTIKALSVSGVTLFCDQLKATTDNIITSPSAIKALYFSAVTMEAHAFYTTPQSPNVTISGDTINVAYITGATISCSTVLASHVGIDTEQDRIQDVNVNTVYAGQVISKSPISNLGGSIIARSLEAPYNFASQIQCYGKIYGLHLTGVTVSAPEIQATNRLYVPTSISGAFLTPLSDAMMFVDESQFKLYFVIGATLRFVDLMAM